MPAEPVSPEVAPMTVKCSRPCLALALAWFRLSRKNSRRFPRNWSATSLKAKVGPWNSSSRCIFLLSSNVIVGVTLSARNDEYDWRIIALRESCGISAGEMKRLKISNTRDWNGRLAQSFSQSDGREGMISGINSPLSGARPLKTASSKDTCKP